MAGLLALSTLFALLRLVLSQDCGTGRGYFDLCGGCCATTALAGCYQPLTILGTQTITVGPYDCYTSPPGRVVDFTTEPASVVSTSAPAAVTTDGGGAGQCLTPHVSCSDGGCYESGAICCANGGACRTGEYCDGAGCCPDGEVCSGGTGGCTSSEKSCGGKCIPQDGECCSDGRYCAAGTSCDGNGGCADGSVGGGSTEYCSRYASYPKSCGSNCIPQDAQCCSDGRYCAAGTSCDGNGGCADSGAGGGGSTGGCSLYLNYPKSCGSSCIPQSAQCCSNGRYCADGTYCGSNGDCVYDGVGGGGGGSTVQAITLPATATLPVSSALAAGDPVSTTPVDTQPATDFATPAGTQPKTSAATFPDSASTETLQATGMSATAAAGNGPTAGAQSLSLDIAKQICAAIFALVIA